MRHVHRAVTDFLRRHVSARIELGDDDDIFASGLVNSLLALQLVLFVETEFGLTVEDGDLSLDNFRSIAAIERYVTGKLATGSPSATQ